MKVSLNTIKQYIDFELPPVDELVKRINEQLGGVEEVVDLADKYKDAKVVKVVECEKHPNADRLNVCKIDAGTGDLIQVVCGAPNVHADMWTVWLPPEAIVPSTYGTDEQLKLGARELRGVMSNGMLAAADELAIGTDHDGIIEIDPDEWKPNDNKVEPGASFAKAYGLDDTIIDIENKMFTHRPDLFGQLGVAREIAGILGHAFTSPDWYLDTPKFEDGSGLELEVFNEAGEKVPRLMFAAMKNIEIKPSPLWLQCALVAMGSKAINNIVDVTNYVMLLTAQPTHAYDYDTLRGQKIGARMAKKGETVELLNGKTYQLSEDDIVIADKEGPIALGGIMGGAGSEVSPSTKNIVLEVANFDMYTARKSSMRHGVFTDALTRFNKGQSPLQNDHIMSLLMASVKDVSSGEQAGEVFDIRLNEQTSHEPVSVSQVFINERLGLDLAADATKNLLENVEMSVKDEFTITPPFWRTDIVLPEDVVEEVGRLYGFDKLPRELPQRSTAPAPKNHVVDVKQKLRTAMARSGASEVLTYSFMHEKVLTRAQQSSEKAFKLSNALSPDLQYYRLSLLPSLLDKVHMNSKAGHGEFALFEIGKAHHKDYSNDDGIVEFSRIAAVYASKKKPSGAPYYQAKVFVEQLAKEFGIVNMTFQPLHEFDYAEHDVLRQLGAPFDEKRSAMVWVNDKFGGVVGELKPSVLRSFKLPENTAGFELFMSLFSNASQHRHYKPLSRFPSTWQDISLKVPASVSYDKLFEVASKATSDAAPDIDSTIMPTSIYQAENDSGSKTITLRITLTHHERTLTEKDASAVIEAVAAAAATALDAVHV